MFIPLFFFNDTATTEIYTLSLHDALPISLVMEVARVLSSPDVETDRSIRFILWNNEETGLHGARAYVDQRKDRQGKEDPPGSGRYPEPKWLGLIQHDMMLFDLVCRLLLEKKKKNNKRE